MFLLSFFMRMITETIFILFVQKFEKGTFKET